MKRNVAFLPLCLFVCVSAAAASLESKPKDPYFKNFHPLKAPAVQKGMLQPNDRLAICGDSITEQKMYSRLMETYLTVAYPDLNISTRQYGWSGEQASGFLARMTNDVLRFHPTIATTCYGMNDHHYQPYKDEIGAAYRSNSVAIVHAFKASGTRVVQGSPGCMGPKTAWGFVKGTAEERNLNLCELRNIDVQIAKSEHVGFADVFWPMFRAEYAARQKYGQDFALAGKDAVHPGWAGHLVMAYAFLKALGCDGDIGTFTVDLKSSKASVSKGHELISCFDGRLQIQSARYPLCAVGATNDDASVRAGMAAVPFNQELNRLVLIAKHGKAKKYKVTWGTDAKSFSASELSHGINLADEFPNNPFCKAYERVDKAVAEKQAFETKQIKQLFHGAKPEEMERVVAETEKQREPLVAAIKAAFVPVNHTIKIEAE